MHDERLTIALDFIAVHRMAVIATCTALHEPSCALVAYAAQGAELIVGTDDTTRKYANLQRSPRVALVIGRDGPTTLQYEGEARELDREAARPRAALLLARHPETAPFLSHAGARTFLIAPRWLRFTDYSSPSPNIFELSFPAPPDDAA